MRKLSQHCRRLVPSLFFPVIVLAACSVRQLEFVPDSQLEMSEGDSNTGATSSSAGSKNKAGSGSGGSSSMGGKTSTAGTSSGGTTTVGGTGTAGSPPQGGMGGMGGMPPMTCPTVRSAKNQPLIDDFEDGNAGLPMPMMGGRAGGWYVVSDDMSPMATLTPPADPTRPPNPVMPGYVDPNMMMPGMMGYALRLNGRGFRGWGAEIATNFLFIPELGKACPYYIEGFQGIRFFIKGQVADDVVRFGLATQETVDIKSGGFCDPDKTKCYDTFSYEISPVPTDWTQVSIPFAKLEQLQGSMMGLNLTHVIGIEFAVHGAQNTTTGICPDNLCAFDLWIDQIEFF